MNFENLIEKRQSIRSFHDKAVSEAQLAQLGEYFNKEEALVRGIETRLLYAVKDAGSRLDGIAGYRGNAFFAPAYLLILSEKKEGYLENAGFMGEHLLLKLTDMGLSGCWLTVDNPEVVKKALLLDSPLEVAVVIAIGYGKEERSTTRVDILTPSNVKFESRQGHVAPKISQEEMVYNETFGTSAVWEEERFDPYLDKALYAASLAPAFLNRQSYRYLMKGNRLYLLAGGDDMTSERDGALNLGATMLNFHIVYSQYMHQGDGWELGESGDQEAMKLPQDYRIAASYKLW